ncbi:MAG: hypothetical protein HYY23_14140 [Verrucomicrobia bacterium]|nr:hypothetical protein [Verrucomicrobiota bacterium]
MRRVPRANGFALAALVLSPLVMAPLAGLASDRWQWEAVGKQSSPPGRIYMSAVWTGSEFLFWGGRLLDGHDDWRNDGFRYDPRTDRWKPITTAGAPAPRYANTAVWTGRELIVWGGRRPTGRLEESYNTGARYDPVADKWTPVNLAGAPARRDSHTAVWTGKEMIVWGGFSIGYPDTWNDGGRYDPGTDSWKPLSLANAPNPRQDHTAVWTGREMLVWGGRRLLLERDDDDEDTKPQPYFVYPADLGQYDPATDTWTTKYVPNTRRVRAGHSAIWTGQEMIVWGGVTETSRRSGELLMNDGARFNPATQSWTPTSNAAVPSGRSRHIGLWTGKEMLILGGSGEGNSGGRYDPASDSWTPISLVGAPHNSLANGAVWTGEGMLVFHDSLSFYFEPGSYARDHLPDQWQRRYFGENNVAGLPAADPDLDGQDNLHEFLAGTDPTDSNSRFRLRIEKGAASQGAIKLSFSPRLEDRTYVLEASPNLAPGGLIRWDGVNPETQGLKGSVFDLDAADFAQFYRVRISLP